MLRKMQGYACREDISIYYMEGRELSVVSCEKDLGVRISADMKSSVRRPMPVTRPPTYWA